ncbi:hypothetical protein NMY22_g7155 [Coprinellus aureogranulatus]|nr:hypothetical protein NMY22_g7155 [Coprinellus aureogranulatus]
MLHIVGGRIIQQCHDRTPPPAEKENQQPPTAASNSVSQTLGRRRRSTTQSEADNDNLSWAPRKKAARTDPLVSHGRHFGRTVHAFCRPFPLIKEGLSRMIQIQARVLNEDDIPNQERREHEIFKALLDLSPGLDTRILKASADELHYVADMLNKGSTGARADDTKALKSVIVDWITPQGGALSPPLSRNVKTDRGFYHYKTGELLCPATLDWNDESVRTELRSGEIAVTGDIWPAFLYRNHKLSIENPWDGLMKGSLLVSAYKHVFTSPSSVDQEVRATRSGNAEIHGMKSVTIASLAYIATLVRNKFAFALLQILTGLLAGPVLSELQRGFCRNDRATDSERFYKSIVDFLTSPSELEEVQELIDWWNRKIFPSHHADNSTGKPPIPSVRDMLKQWRENKKSALSEHQTNTRDQEPSASPRSPGGTPSDD